MTLLRVELFPLSSQHGSVASVASAVGSCNKRHQRAEEGIRRHANSSASASLLRSMYPCVSRLPSSFIYLCFQLRQHASDQLQLLRLCHACQLLIVANDDRRCCQTVVRD